MTKPNEPEDIFQSIDMHGGDQSVCWEWLGSINRKGMPYFPVKGRKYVAYRLVKHLVHGGFNLLDERVMMLHQCKDEDGKAIDNPLCCNPFHIKLGTHEDNMMEMMLRGRSGLTREALCDILQLHKEFPELTHGQIGKRIEHKHKVSCARQTVTDILNQRRRAVLQQAIRDDEAKITGENNGEDGKV